MTPFSRGLVIALVQVLIVGAVGGKLLYDRRTLPSVWAPTVGVDPVLPIRGRYVSLNLVVEPDAVSEPRDIAAGLPAAATLSVEDGVLRATFTADPAMDAIDWSGVLVERRDRPGGARWTLVEPIAFFLPESAPDPSRLQEGETLWAEVTVPRRGPPRPIRLEVRR
jgi:hypothetical protein